jgi:hypothetical protein
VLRGLIISASELIEILEHTPLLVEMDFIPFNFQTDDKLMKRVIYDADSDEQEPCLVRKLEVLTFRNDLFIDLSLVGDLVDSRWFPDESDHKYDAASSISGLRPSCLREVDLHVRENKVKEFERTVLPRLAECRDEGLDIEFIK